MFFFIAGIQPKSVEMDDHPRMCPACGLYQFRLRRIDHYLSIFFLPLLRVKKGTPYLECRSCGHMADESGRTESAPLKRDLTRCPNCHGPLEPGFRFCPHCGKAVRGNNT